MVKTLKKSFKYIQNNSTIKENKKQSKKQTFLTKSITYLHILDKINMHDRYVVKVKLSVKEVNNELLCKNNIICRRMILIKNELLISSFLICYYYNRGSIKMKEIIYNYNELNKDEINRYVKRSKLIIENSKGKILLVKEFNTYQLPGGHVEDNESFNEALIREIKEETGIELSKFDRKPILKIRYLKRNFPDINVNTEYIGYYYSEKINESFNLNNLNLTNEEALSDYKLEYIDKKKILKKLNNNLKITKTKEVVIDTIEAIKEYLNNY